MQLTPQQRKPLTLEHRLNIGRALVGRKKPPFTENHRRKISEAKKGTKMSEESKRKLSDSKKNCVFSKEHRLALSRAKLGKPNIYILGSKNPSWRGGVTSRHKRIRESIEYRLWREAVFARDNWTCQNPECLKRGVKLNAHHIKPFALFPELRTSIDNGVTLCEKCHREVAMLTRLNK